MKTDTNVYNFIESKDLFVTFADFDDDRDMSSDSEIDRFLQNIEINSKKEDSGTRPNLYYCPEFVFSN